MAKLSHVVIDESESESELETPHSSAPEAHARSDEEPAQEPEERQDLRRSTRIVARPARYR